MEFIYCIHVSGGCSNLQNVHISHTIFTFREFGFCCCCCEFSLIIYPYSISFPLMWVCELRSPSIPSLFIRHSLRFYQKCHLLNVLFMLHNKHLLVFLNRKVCKNIWQYDFSFLFSLPFFVMFVFFIPLFPLFFLHSSIYLWATREIESWYYKKTRNKRKSVRREAPTIRNRVREKIF